MAHRSRGSADGRRSDWDEDRDFWVDKEGIPHWNGVDMVHLKQYRARVRLEYESILGDTDWAKERRATLGMRLTRGLTHKAWEAVESVLEDVAPLKQDGGHKLVLTALEKMDKAEVLRKQQKFDDFFKRSTRRHGQEMGDYLREKERTYADFRALDKATALSDDLYAYFLLEGARPCPSTAHASRPRLAP